VPRINRVAVNRSDTIDEQEHPWQVQRMQGTLSARVAVVTPYFRTPNRWLERCLASVRAQNYSCTHFLIADGEPQQIVKDFGCEHIILPRSHGDYGDTPRSIGSLKAIEQGFDAVAYLDADNWYQSNHISSLIGLHQKTGAAICTSKRRICHLDGREMAICLTSDGEQFCDTSCLMLTRSAFDMVSVWRNIADDEHAIDDRIMWYNILKSGHSRAHTDLPTVCYTADHAGFYLGLGWPIPEGVRNSAATKAAYARWIARGNPPLPYSGLYRRLPQRERQEDPVLPWLPGLYARTLTPIPRVCQEPRTCVNAGQNSVRGSKPGPGS
jgi:hypothetical protein